MRALAPHACHPNFKNVKLRDELKGWNAVNIPIFQDRTCEAT